MQAQKRVDDILLLSKILPKPPKPQNPDRIYFLLKKLNSCLLHKLLFKYCSFKRNMLLRLPPDPSCYFLGLADGLITWRGPAVRSLARRWKDWQVFGLWRWLQVFLEDCLRLQLLLFNGTRLQRYFTMVDLVWVLQYDRVALVTYQCGCFNLPCLCVAGPRRQLDAYVLWSALKGNWPLWT